MKRTPEIVVVSDLHLGTYGCHAKELLLYLKSIKPKILILNGDIIDIWNFKKSYFPREHTEVIQRILKLATSGTKVYYLTGNHDDILRKFGEMTLGDIQLRDKLVFYLNGKSYWAFHGDVFDASVKNARWLAQLGGKGYDILIRINRSINWIRGLGGFGPVSFSAKMKKKVKSAVKFIGDFEETATLLAAENGYDYVICGHIHQPQIKTITTPNGENVTYMNSGDWIEHLTALEYQFGKWTIFQYDSDDFESENPKLQVKDKKNEKYSIPVPDVVPQAAHKELAAFEF